jgi:regulator of sigma E protease
VAGDPAFAVEDVHRASEKRPGRTFDLVVERDGRPLTLSATARRDLSRTPGGVEVAVGRIGVVIATKIERTEPYGPVDAAWQGGARTWDLTVLTVKGLWKILSRQIEASNIGGPIQIASEAGRQAKEGLGSLALFTAIISVNLAVLNLLPVPMLDGGHLLFFLIEAVLGRPLSLKKREAAQQLGFVLLMLLMVYALYNDLVRIDAFKFLRQ